ncbi:hypothetical protein ZIOFF_063161 [Zingiber officinale]|uniref:K-box domain-containing protein n=1 Tax=Zingiber officinale TaxID=94328 RepID=A0A8J5F246_ZINOF|nr:hypothetical protein ZIOFF_063161 [Zingiber officinale]
MRYQTNSGEKLWDAKHESLSVEIERVKKENDNMHIELRHLKGEDLNSLYPKEMIPIEEALQIGSPAQLLMVQHLILRTPQADPIPHCFLASQQQCLGSILLVVFKDCIIFMEASTCQMCLVRLHLERPQWVLYHQVVFSNQEEAFLVDSSHQTIFWLHYLKCLMALVSQIEGGINVVGNHAFSSSNINGVTGSITGISSSLASGNRSSVPGLGVSPVPTPLDAAPLFLFSPEPHTAGRLSSAKERRPPPWSLLEQPTIAEILLTHAVQAILRYPPASSFIFLPFFLCPSPSSGSPLSPLLIYQPNPRSGPWALAEASLPPRASDLVRLLPCFCTSASNPRSLQSIVSDLCPDIEPLI